VIAGDQMFARAGKLPEEAEQPAFILCLRAKGGEYPAFCVSVIWSMLPERSKDDDDLERTAGRAFEELRAA
jgi:hypothetical protein